MALPVKPILIYSFKALNFVLAVVGAMMTLYSVWMFTKWHEILDNSPPTLTINAEHSNDATDSLSASLANIFRVNYSTHNNKLSYEINIELPATWYIYTFAFTGYYLLITAILGSVAGEIPTRRLLTIYVSAISTLVVLEVCSALFVAAIGTSNLPYDGTGFVSATGDLISDYPVLSRMIISFIFLVQVAGGLVAFGLRYFATHQVSIVREDDLHLQAPLIPPHESMNYPPIIYN